VRPEPEPELKPEPEPKLELEPEPEPEPEPELKPELEEPMQRSQGLRLLQLVCRCEPRPPAEVLELERHIRHLDMATATYAGEAPVPIRTKRGPLSHCL
jgi:hypothetical protein